MASRGFEHGLSSNLAGSRRLGKLIGFYGKDFERNHTGQRPAARPELIPELPAAAGAGGMAVSAETLLILSADAEISAAGLHRGGKLALSTLPRGDKLQAGFPPDIK